MLRVIFEDMALLELPAAASWPQLRRGALRLLVGRLLNVVDFSGRRHCQKLLNKRASRLAASASASSSTAAALAVSVQRSGSVVSTRSGTLVTALERGQLGFGGTACEFGGCVLCGEGSANPTGSSGIAEAAAAELPALAERECDGAAGAAVSILHAMARTLSPCR